MDAAPPQLAALLAACRGRPADDLPRLVLADWLDDHGDPARAAFVRVQVELSHPTADAARLRHLRDAAKRLLETHREAWVGACLEAFQPKPRSPGRAAARPRHGTPDWSFVRGLLRLDNTAAHLTRRTFRQWLRSPEACWLEQVALDYPTVDQFVKADLPDELHGRVALDLTLDGRTPADGWGAAFRLLAVSSNFTAVRALTVGGVDGEAVLAELVRGDVSQLVELTLHGADTGRMAQLIAAAPFTALSSLSVGRLAGHGVTALIGSPHLGNLTHLSLIGSEVGDAGMLALCRSKLADTLRDVQLANTGIGDAGAAAFARSPLFAHLHGPQLNLMMNRIGDAGLTALAGSEHLLRFRELVLRQNRDPETGVGGVGDAGVIALAESPYSANLEYLDFWRNRITDRGAFALARSPHLSRVVDLSVKENAVTEAGAAALHERFGDRAKVG